MYIFFIIVVVFAPLLLKWISVNRKALEIIHTKNLPNVSKRYDWEATIIVNKYCRCVNTTHQDFVPGIKFRIYIITHDSFSSSVAQKWIACKPWAREIRISTTKFFESYAYTEELVDLISEMRAVEFVGLATYRSLKFVSLEKMKCYLELAQFKPYDVVPMYTTGERLVPQAVSGHGKRFKRVWYRFVRSMGYTIAEIRATDDVEVFLRNTFIARTREMINLTYFMEKAIFHAQHNSSVRALLASDAHYKEARYRKNTAQRVFGAKHYQWHPFIFERLPVFFFANQPHVRVYGSLYQEHWFGNNYSTTSLFEKL